MTDIAKLELELAALRSQADTLTASMHSLVPACCGELAAAAAEWINQELARQVDSHPDVVTAMGARTLKAVKDQVAALLTMLPQVTAEVAGEGAAWPHRGMTQSGSDREPFFTATFRAIIGRLGPILDVAGFLTRDGYAYPAWQRSSTGFRYQINPGFKSHDHVSMRNYEEHYARYRKLSQDIALKAKELEKAKARELWESA